MSCSLCGIALLAAMGLLGGNTEVQETSAHYSCCESPAVEFNQQCENTWSTDNQPIAFSRGGDKHCIPPCKKIEDGLMVLTECAPVNVTTVCTNEQNVAEEKRIYYLNDPCSGSPSAAGSHGFLGLLLLAALIRGLCVTC